MARSYDEQEKLIKKMLAALEVSRIYIEALEKHLDPTIDPGAPTIREHASMVRAAIADATKGTL